MIDIDKDDHKVDPARGQRLLQLMKHRNINQTELAHRIGVSQGAINKIIAGGDSALFPKIARELKANINWLIFGEENPPWEQEKIDKFGPGKVPLIKWHQIPNLSSDPEKLYNENNQSIDITFHKEKNLFATQIPKCIDPGNTNEYFRRGEIALISPRRELASAQHIIVIEDGWLEPVFAYYWVKGEIPTIRYPWEMRLRKVTEKMQICGVVVATMNILLLSNGFQ